MNKGNSVLTGNKKALESSSAHKQTSHRFQTAIGQLIEIRMRNKSNLKRPKMPAHPTQELQIYVLYHENAHAHHKNRSIGASEPKHRLYSQQVEPNDNDPEP